MSIDENCKHCNRLADSKYYDYGIYYVDIQVKSGTNAGLDRFILKDFEKQKQDLNICCDSSKLQSYIK